MAKKVEFGEAYPTIASLHLKAIEDEGGIGKKYQAHNFTEHNFLAVLDCHNQLCSGGVDIGKMLHKLAGERQTVINENLFCAGREGGNAGRSCTHSFSVKGTITYKPNNALKLNR